MANTLTEFILQRPETEEKPEHRKESSLVMIKQLVLFTTRHRISKKLLRWIELKSEEHSIALVLADIEILLPIKKITDLEKKRPFHIILKLPLQCFLEPSLASQ